MHERLPAPARLLLHLLLPLSWASMAGCAQSHRSSCPCPAGPSPCRCEIVRSVAGDLAEEVKLIDDFTHPKTVRWR